MCFSVSGGWPCEISVGIPLLDELPQSGGFRMWRIRTGDPIDDDEDIALDHWAGIIPLTTTVGVPIVSANLPASVSPKDELLDALANY
jgi:hypothetical protein